MKAWKQTLKGEEPVPTVAYLSEVYQVKTPKWDSTLPGLVRALQAAASKYVH